MLNVAGFSAGSQLLQVGGGGEEEEGEHHLHVYSSTLSCVCVCRSVCCSVCCSWCAVACAVTCAAACAVAHESTMYTRVLTHQSVCLSSSLLLLPPPSSSSSFLLLQVGKRSLGNLLDQSSKRHSEFIKRTCERGGVCVCVCMFVCMYVCVCAYEMFGGQEKGVNVEIVFLTIYSSHFNTPLMTTMYDHYFYCRDACQHPWQGRRRGRGRRRTRRGRRGRR